MKNTQYLVINRDNRKEYILNAEELTKFFKHQNIKDLNTSTGVDEIKKCVRKTIENKDIVKVTFLIIKLTFKVFKMYSLNIFW